MKKILFALAAGFIPALIATNQANAQNSVNTELMDTQKSEMSIEKVMAGENDHAIDMGVISPKALKDFTKAHKNVSGESWEKIRDGFSAKFTQNGVRNIVYYNTKGKWAGSLKGYGEDQLPKDIREMVKRQYFDYAITYVQEAETTESNGIPTYVIHLEDKYGIKQIRVSDGQMDVYREFKKQL